MTDELNGKLWKKSFAHEVNFIADYLGGTKQSAKGVEKSIKKTLHQSLCVKIDFSPNSQNKKKWQN